MKWRDVHLVRGGAGIWPHAPDPMSLLSPAGRVRRTFMYFGLTMSILAFVVGGADVLFDQWIEGKASAVFIFGTACLIAAACTTLFAAVMMIGVAISSAFSDEPPSAGPQPTSEPRDIAPSR